MNTGSVINARIPVTGGGVVVTFSFRYAAAGKNTPAGLLH